MPRNVYSDEFKAEAVRLYDSGAGTRRQIASELGIAPDTLSGWIHKARKSSESLNVSERERLRQAEKEVKRLREENQILKKAAAFFATESTRNS